MSFLTRVAPGLSQTVRSLSLNGSKSLSSRAYLSTYPLPKPVSSSGLSLFNKPNVSQLKSQQIRSSSSGYATQPSSGQSLTSVLDREIQEETTELNQRLQSDQFPGFSVETDGADVKLTKQTGESTVTIRFTVSSSLSEWRTNKSDGDPANQNQEQQEAAYSLISLPDFQVQISRDNKTFEVSCYFEQLDQDEETGEAYPMEPVFNIDELVMYEGEPKETEFAVSAEYFREDLQEGLLQYLAEHGIDDEFVKNLVQYSTNYEKKQYIGLMKRIRDFVSK